LIPVSVGKQTQFKIDKIIGTREKRGIKEHKVRWLGYGPDFDSWIKASTIKRFKTLIWKSTETTFMLHSSVTHQQRYLL